MLCIRDRIGLLIKEARTRQGLTQDKLAEKLSVSESFVGQLERGEAMPSVETLQLIITELHIDPRSVFLDAPHGDSEYAELRSIMLHMSANRKKLLLDFAKLLLNSDI